ncbi:MAG: hypothetical protein J7J30_01565 [Candidatus Odinarchaeota archaeon]|nr:hypothetical protein [Candidatus Odinarchaeota archaeon]
MNVSVEKMLIMAISLSFVVFLCVPLLNVTLNIINITLQSSDGETLIHEIEKGINYALVTLKTYHSNVTVPEGFEIWSEGDTLYIKYNVNGTSKTYEKSFSFQVNVTSPTLPGRYELRIWLDGDILMIVFRKLTG